MRKIIKVSLLLLVVQLGIFLNGVTIQTTYTIQADASANFEKGDIISYLDIDAVNVTYAITPSTTTAKITPNSVNTNTVYSLNNVLVRSSTYPYSILQNDNSGSIPIMHNGNQQFLQAYYQVAHLTGEYRLDKINQMLQLQNKPDLLQQNFKISSSTNIASVQKALALMSTVNDTASANGFVATENAKVSLADLAGRQNVPLNVSDPNMVTYQSTKFDPRYQKYASDLSGNTSQYDLVTSTSDITKSKVYNFGISGFYNTEQEGFLNTLTANIAANKSTSADPLTPDRIKILDYTAWNASLKNYISSDYQQRIRDAVDNSDSNSATALSEINVWGLFKIQGKPYVISAGAFDLLGGLSKAVSTVTNTAKVVVGTVTKPISSAASSALNPIQSAYNQYVAAPIINTVSAGANTVVEAGKAIVSAALKAPETVSNLANSGKDFVGSVTTKLADGGQSLLHTASSTIGGAVDGILTTGKKIINSPLDFISGVTKGLGGTLTTILLFVGLGAGLLLLGYVVYKYFLNRPQGPKGMRPF